MEGILFRVFRVFRGLQPFYFTEKSCQSERFSPVVFRAIPKGLRPPALGCDERATQEQPATSATPKELRPIRFSVLENLPVGPHRANSEEGPVTSSICE
jgi:hypothetical protein